MDALPVMAGLITAIALFVMGVSLIAYRRTGMNRLLAITGISAILLLKGVLIFLDIWGTMDVSPEIMAGMDLLMAFALVGALLGKE